MHASACLYACPHACPTGIYMCLFSKCLSSQGVSWRQKATNVDRQRRKICIPDSMKRHTVEWYHNYLCHLGGTWTEETIHQHFTWHKLQDDICAICGKCHCCQANKHSGKKYGTIPEKEAEAEPWERLNVDLVGPYKIKQKGKKTLKLWAVTMIDPATSWFKMRECPDKEAIIIANLVEQTWLTRYP